MSRLLQRKLAAKDALEAARKRKDTRGQHEASERLKAATTALLRQETRKPWWAGIVSFFNAAGMA